MRRSLHLILALALVTSTAFPQPSRIRGKIDNGQRVSLRGHLHPHATAANDQGALNSSEVLPSLTLVLKPSAEQQAALTKLIADQQDPKSASYHQWLTPEQFAERFGASQSDIDKISAWLEEQDLHVTHVARARNAVGFSGTAGDVGKAFQTRFHRYAVNGEEHFANAAEPTLPAPMAVVVRGIKGLNDFKMKPKLHRLSVDVSPQYTTASGNHYLAPADFATIYNVKSLHAAGYDGTGQKIVVAGQTRVTLSDIQTFRTRFQLGDNDPTFTLVPGSRDPGTISGDMEEADLDLEWTGAVAPKAQIQYVYASDVMDAVAYAIDQNLAPVISVSYGLCESQTAQSDASLLQTWAQQGNAQGITWINAAGDSGGADCYAGGSTRGVGLAVDLPASIPEVTGLGGTTLNEGSGQYWNTTTEANGASAVSYIPEVVWNDSTSGSPASGGGGSSVYFARPSWQSGSGWFDDAMRSVPDVSLASSAQHDGYLVYNRGRLLSIGGTSAAAPSFAGIAAILNQYLVANGLQSAPGLGNMNPGLYALAQSSPGTFHDVVEGDNVITITCGPRSRSCTAGSYGFQAGAGYDRASGLGSVDAYSLVLGWQNGQKPASRLTATLQLASDGTSQVMATLAAANGTVPTGVVTFMAGDSVLGTAGIDASSGTAVATLAYDLTQLPKDTVITARYEGDGTFESASASLNLADSTPPPPLP